MFWPDLASCHYAKKTLGWLESLEFAGNSPRTIKLPHEKTKIPLDEFLILLDYRYMSSTFR
jgi:hypothetical protein